MSPAGFMPENHEWLDTLATGKPGVGGMLKGRDPRTISPEVLASAGHPKRSTATLRAAMCKGTSTSSVFHNSDMESRLSSVKEYRDIKTFCTDYCAEDRAAVRDCAIINCPFWAFRTGKNPHRPKQSPEARERSARILAAALER